MKLTEDPFDHTEWISIAEDKIQVVDKCRKKCV